jgi:hypothetical protein
MLLQGVKRLRLLRKQPPPSGGQQPQEGDLGLKDEDSAARRQVYLVTLPHPRTTHGADGTPLTAPETLTKDNWCGVCISPHLNFAGTPMRYAAPHTNGVRLQRS